MSESLLNEMSEHLGRLLKESGLFVVTAESCTAGGLAEVITRTPGSSGWFERGFVTYSNAAKREMLQVSSGSLADYGAVSEEVAAEMASGALVASHGQLSVAVTGIAGPDGGTEEKPVGTVCFAWQGDGESARTARVVFEGDRHQVRQQACLMALQGLIDMLERQL